MNINRFGNLNIDLILQNLQIEEKRECEQEEEEYNFESPTMNPQRHNKYENRNQESEYKISSKYKGNVNALKQDDDGSYSSLEHQNKGLQSSETSKENNNSAGSCTPPKKNNANRFDLEFEQEKICEDDYQNNTNIQKITPNNNKYHDRNMYSPPQQNEGAKFKINLERFQLSATSSNKKIQEEMKQKSQQSILLSSNRKNCKGSLFEKETPPSCSSIKNSLFSQTPKILSHINMLSATPSKNMITRTLNASNKKCNTNSINRHRQKNSNIFMSSQPQNYYSEQKNGKEKIPLFSKRLFQDNSDNEDDDNNNNNINNNEYKYNLKQPVSKFEYSDFKIKSKMQELEKIEENNSPNGNIPSSFDGNNFFSSPINNSPSKKGTLFSALDYPTTKEVQSNNNNNSVQQLRQNNLFKIQLDTIPKKGLNLQKDDQSTVKKTVFQIPSPPTQFNSQISSLDSFIGLFPKDKSNEDDTLSRNHPTLENTQNSMNKQKNCLIEETNIIKQNVLPPFSNKLNHLNAELNLINLPQVNEFSFETDREDEEEENKQQLNKEINFNEKNFFNMEYDSDAFLRKNTRPVEKWESDSQSEDVSQNGLNSFVTEDFPDQNNLQLIFSLIFRKLHFIHYLINSPEINSSFFHI